MIESSSRVGPVDQMSDELSPRLSSGLAISFRFGGNVVHRVMPAHAGITVILWGIEYSRDDLARVGSASGHDSTRRATRSGGGDEHETRGAAGCDPCGVSRPNAPVVSSARKAARRT